MRKKKNSDGISEKLIILVKKGVILVTKKVIVR